MVWLALLLGQSVPPLRDLSHHHGLLSLLAHLFLDRGLVLGEEELIGGLGAGGDHDCFEVLLGPIFDICGFRAVFKHKVALGLQLLELLLVALPVGCLLIEIGLLLLLGHRTPKTAGLAEGIFSIDAIFDEFRDSLGIEVEPGRGGLLGLATLVAVFLCLTLGIFLRLGRGLFLLLGFRLGLGLPLLLLGA